MVLADEWQRCSSRRHLVLNNATGSSQKPRGSTKLLYIYIYIFFFFENTKRVSCPLPSADRPKKCLCRCVWKACARSSFQRAVHEWESDGTIDHVLPYVICTRRLLPGRLAASNSVMNMSSCARRRRCRQLACPVGLVHGKAVPACWIGSTSHTFWLHGESINTVLLRFSSCNGNGTQGRSFLWCCTTATKLQPRSIIIPGTRTSACVYCTYHKFVEAWLRELYYDSTKQTPRPKLQSDPEKSMHLFRD